MGWWMMMMMMMIQGILSDFGLGLAGVAGGLNSLEDILREWIWKKGSRI